MHVHIRHATISRCPSEIDRVIGEDRLPTYTSKDATPYLNAVILETLRWHPSVLNGIPHRVVQDDIYEGRLIPAGTTVFVNAWGILHDKNHFPDPMTFNPDCFLHEDKPESIIDPWDVLFGYGRRICVGIPVVRSGLWIIMAMMLACFEIRPKIDPQTMKPIIPEAKWTGGSTRCLRGLVFRMT
ncbi:hypothetical protein FRB93_006343 [Tulasnella sp. JGI-2019a]|nr:hypothetical protein FRB93_006343 [Tulasnella sp. JGI-2019a]